MSSFHVKDLFVIFRPLHRNMVTDGKPWTTNLFSENFLLKTIRVKLSSSYRERYFLSNSMSVLMFVSLYVGLSFCCCFMDSLFFFLEGRVYLEDWSLFFLKDPDTDPFYFHPDPFYFHPDPFYFHPDLFYVHPDPFYFHPDLFYFHPDPFNFHPDPFYFHQDLFYFHPDPFYFHPDLFYFHPDPFYFHPDPQLCEMVQYSFYTNILRGVGGPRI